MTLQIAEATAADLADWDARAVDAPGGHVYQSRTWADVRQRAGWRPRFLAFSDGFRLLSVERPWRLVGGAGALLPRGPIAAGEPAETTAARLIAAADYLAGVGVDVVASDAQIPASTGYRELIEAAGFRPIEEIQPSRNRLSLALGPGATEEAVFGRLEGRVRQRIRASERGGLRTVRWDARAEAEPGEGFERAPEAEMGQPEGSADGATRPFERLYEMLLDAAARRHFQLATRERFLDWSLAALAAGLLVYLEVRTPEDEVLGGMTLYRHGRRLTSALSGDRSDRRKAFPGVTHLLTWRAVQLAIREGRDEMDFDGADAKGYRNEPTERDPTYGLYRFKRSFGAEWLELTGNHERVMRPARYALGRVTGALSRGRATPPG